MLLMLSAILLSAFSRQPLMAQRPTASTVTLTAKNEPMRSVFKKIEKKTRYKFLFALEDVAQYRVSCRLKDVPIREAMRQIVGNNPLRWKVEGNFVTVSVRKQVEAKASGRERTVKGHVRDENGEELVGVPVCIGESRVCTVTDADGFYTFKIPVESTVLKFSYVGLAPEYVHIGRGDGDVVRDVVLRSENHIDEVVVNGSFTRKANTFTGAVTTVKGDELRRIGNGNALQSMKNLDPSFFQVENLSTGSDPNTMPSYQMRGSSSLSDVQSSNSSANQPLFILDGFETNLTTVMDLDINRVESITTLKDATAKAIYGAKAANGVVVIETIQPKAGKLRVSYNGNLNIEAPDLSSYNMCNAEEKVAAERYAGLFSSDNAETQRSLDAVYNRLVRELMAGVNTDWLAQPTHVGVGQKHSLSIDGGVQDMTYGVNLMYNNIMGVMKGSERNTFSGSINLTYRRKSITVRNLLTISHNKADESPWGNFEKYVRMNPYFRLYDEEGNLKKQWIGLGHDGVYNPIYNATLNSNNTSSYTTINDNFNFEWRVMPTLRLTARMSYTTTSTKTDNFLSPDDLSFMRTDTFKKGSYTKGQNDNYNITAEAGLAYSLTLGKHLVFANAQATMGQSKSEAFTVDAVGFPYEYLDGYGSATAYRTGSKPNGRESITRNGGGYLSLNYSFAERYLFDANYRLSGTSQNQKHWGSFWSLGAGWNVHNEKFMKGLKWLNRLKLRGSYGYTGQQQTSPSQSVMTFTYNTSEVYNGLVGSSISALANKNLKWQEKFDTNFGVDIELLNHRLSARLDIYESTTKGNTTSVDVPYTTGFTSYMANLGKTQNRGVEAYLNGRVYEAKENYVNVNLSMAHNTNKLKEISNSLRKFNENQDKRVRTSIMTKYVEGCSMYAIWAVRSLGIDPVNGKEIYVKKNGDITYDYDVNDQVVCGDTQPKYNGNFGVNASFHGFGFTISANYRWGGQQYNQTLVSKVENARLDYNVDKRVLDSRWKQPGDIARFKSIANTVDTKPTSRFVEDYNLLTLSALNISYDFRYCKFLKRSFLQRLRLSFYTSDLFTISSMKMERGTSYPYSRRYSFSVTANF